MSVLENIIDYQYSPKKIKDILEVLTSIFGEDSCNLTNLDNTVYKFEYSKNNFTFEISDLEDQNFSLVVSKEGCALFSQDYNNIVELKEDMEYKSLYGFADSNSNAVFFEDVKPDIDVFADTDEEVSDDNEELTQTVKLTTPSSIVPDGITKIRVVALRFQNNIIAFRFKTDKGAFDMRIEVASKYGLGGFKTETFINLERINGVLMSSTEKKLRTCVPDVSLCEEDCRKLINAIFDVGENA